MLLSIGLLSLAFIGFGRARDGYKRQYYGQSAAMLIVGVILGYYAVKAWKTEDEKDLIPPYDPPPEELEEIRILDRHAAAEIEKRVKRFKARRTQ